jgi:hypothetical protein
MQRAESNVFPILSLESGPHRLQGWGLIKPVLERERALVKKHR